MKIEKVIPLFRNNDNHIFTNYVPISLLQQLKIILVKIYNTRLDAFIEKHCILNNSPYGFISNISISLVLLELTEEITSAMDNKKNYYWCFHRLFDTINHDLLLAKLSQYGIRAVANDWLTSYLQNC